MLISMLVLIAESKTMEPCRKLVTSDEASAHAPLFGACADEIMRFLSGFDVSSLAERTGISTSLARKMREMIIDFPSKATGEKALSAYTGVVFKALAPHTLPEDALLRAGTHVRIISSLYGLLRPDDIIKPYRLEFKSNADPEGASMKQYWKKDVTVALGEYLREIECGEVLDLMPADASGCVDWKTINNIAQVWKADFQQQDGSALRTPHAGRLKMLRGRLLRKILCEGIECVEGLYGIEGDDLICEGPGDIPGSIRFITV